MKLSVGAKTDVGRIRSGNEDAYLVETPLFVVADGMGGHIAGDVAATTAVEAIADRSSDATPDDPESFARVVRAANKAIWDKASADASLHGMGTTCTLLFLDGGEAHIAHVGDSRAYMLRDGRLERLTEDHTLVARMVKEGKLTLEEADRHPQRNVVTRALGIGEEVRVDLIQFQVEMGDRLLLCSDGLSTMLDDESIQDVLESERDPQTAADLLVDLANEAGGDDNVTVILVDLDEVGAPSGAAGGQTDAPPEPPARADTPGAIDLPPVVRVRSRARWPRRVAWLLVLGVLAVGGIYAANYTLDNSWFVGVNEDELVTIYRGIPDEIAGISFRDVEQITGLSIDDLPEWKRGDVRDEMKFDTLDDARSNVSALERISRDFAQPARERSTKQGG